MSKPLKPDQNVAQLEREFPDIFEHRDFSHEALDDFIVVKIPNAETGKKEEKLDDTKQSSPHENIFPEADGISLDNLESLIADTLDDFDWEAHQPKIELPAIFLGDWAGSPNPKIQANKNKICTPTTETLAFYLPYHYFGSYWYGIYLTLEGVQVVASFIRDSSQKSVSKIDAVRSARKFLYYHESFHHMVECFATRLEISHRQKIFTTGFEQHYQATLGSNQCLEEALANARALKETTKKKHFQHNIQLASSVKEAIKNFIELQPAGYNQGTKYARPAVFNKAQGQLAEDSFQLSIPKQHISDYSIWLSMGHMFTGISNIKGRANYIIPRRSSIAKRVPLKHSLTPTKLIKKLKKVANIQLRRNGSCHDIYETPDGHTTCIPRHPRDIQSGTLRKILRDININQSVSEFLSN